MVDIVMEKRPELPMEVIKLVKLDPHNEKGYSLITVKWHKPIIVWMTLIYALLFPMTNKVWNYTFVTSKALKKLISKVKELESPAQMVLGNLVPSGVLNGYYSALWTDGKETQPQWEFEQKIAQSLQPLDE